MTKGGGGICAYICRFVKIVYCLPTLGAPFGVLDGVEQGVAIPRESAAKAQAVVEQHKLSFQKAVNAGVRVSMGTDSGVMPHGRNLAARTAVLVKFSTTYQRGSSHSTSCCSVARSWLPSRYDEQRKLLGQLPMPDPPMRPPAAIGGHRRPSAANVARVTALVLRSALNHVEL